MIIRVHNFFEKRRNERGDVVQTIFMFPIALFLLFALINMSSYFQMRGQVQNVARDGARLVALYGGASTGAIRNNTGQSVQTQVTNILWDGSKCKLSYCTQKPVVTCTPNVATQAGQVVSCTIKYYYSPIAPVPKGLEGFNGVTGQPMSVSATYISETGKRN
jgi:Flp pilus assembly protein TadG